MFNNILLAVDGSEHSLHAAKMAGDVARAMQSATLRIVVAFDSIPAYLGEPNFDQITSRRVLEADAILKSAQEAVGQVPAEIHTEVLEGSPAEAIIDVASTRQNDLIIMGSRGLGTLSGLLLGSQSQKVVSHATCPVLIVR
jgi:nucleotide-binding universal stress UspA family protein